MAKFVKFVATKTVQKPTTVVFRTKSGEVVRFKAIETVEEKVPVKFRAKTK